MPQGDLARAHLAQLLDELADDQDPITDVMGDEPIWVGGKVVGWVTSGGYGHGVDQSLAQGYIPTELVQADMQLEIEILGERRPARLQTEPPFDPQALRMRM